MKGLFEEHYTSLNGGTRYLRQTNKPIQTRPKIRSFDWIFQKQKILERKKEEMAELERQKALKKNKNAKMASTYFEKRGHSPSSIRAFQTAAAGGS